MIGRLVSNTDIPTIIVPARLASTRFPRKLLADAGGQPLILRTAKRLLDQAPEFELFFAVDGEELAEPLLAEGYSCIFTDPSLPSGTDRVAEANLNLNRDIVVNVQADEPLVKREHILALVEGITQSEADLATIATPFKNKTHFNDPNQVKVVLDRSGCALYFSRCAIPYERGTGGDVNTSSFKHIGMYAYTRQFLRDFSSLPVGVLEELEKLEQLRALENGKRIAVQVVSSGSIGIDTPRDLAELKF